MQDLTASVLKQIIQEQTPVNEIIDYTARLTGAEQVCPGFDYAGGRVVLVDWRVVRERTNCPCWKGTAIS